MAHLLREAFAYLDQGRSRGPLLLSNCQGTSRNSSPQGGTDRAKVAILLDGGFVKKKLAQKNDHFVHDRRPEQSIVAFLREALLPGLLATPKR